MIERTQNFSKTIAFQKIRFEESGFHKNKQTTQLNTLKDFAENDPKALRYINALDSLGIDVEIGMTSKNEYAISALNTEEQYGVPSFNKKQIKGPYEVILCAIESGLEKAKEKLRGA